MTEDHCIVGDKKIIYIIKKRHKQRHINFIVHQDGSLVVTAPKMCKQSIIKKEIIKNSKWILKQVGHKKENVTIDIHVINHMKKACKPIIEARLLQFNSYYDFTYHRVTIRHQKSRWGSCSSEGNLNFNCKLMCLSGALVDYVVVHELCHLQEMNHSKNFWKLVEKTIPDYKDLRKELKNSSV